MTPQEIRDLYGLPDSWSNETVVKWYDGFKASWKKAGFDEAGLQDFEAGYSPDNPIPQAQFDAAGS